VQVKPAQGSSEPVAPRIYFFNFYFYKVYQVKEITKETNLSDNNKSQAIEIRKGTKSSLKKS
jgi:hypothetical protein